MYACATTTECLSFVLFVKNKWNNRQFKSQTKMLVFLLRLLGFKCSSIKNFPHFSIRLKYINCMCLWSCFMLIILPVPTGSYMAFRWYSFSPYGKMFCITVLAAYKLFLNSIFHCHCFKPFWLNSLLFHRSKIKRRIVFWFEKLLYPYSWIITHCIQQATDTNACDNTSKKKTA